MCSSEQEEPGIMIGDLVSGWTCSRPDYGPLDFIVISFHHMAAIIDTYISVPLPHIKGQVRYGTIHF